MLSILGVGFPRTGTSSLAEALRILGYETLHHAPGRIDLDSLRHSGFRVYDDVDAVMDAPACAFYRELHRAYKCRCILTIRDVDSWWESITWHTYKILTGGDAAHARYTQRLHAMLFGSEWPNEYLWKRRYKDHANAVSRSVPNKDLLVMNICDGGHKWAELCEFLGVDEPAEEFPWQNRKVMG